MKIIRLRSVVVLFLVTQMVFAAGLGNVEKAMQGVQNALDTLSITTVTVAFLWVGYKVLFAGVALREMGSTILGAVIIAGAAQIASLLLGK